MISFLFQSLTTPHSTLTLSHAISVYNYLPNVSVYIFTIILSFFFYQETSYHLRRYKNKTLSLQFSQYPLILFHDYCNYVPMKDVPLYTSTRPLYTAMYSIQVETFQDWRRAWLPPLLLRNDRVKTERIFLHLLKYFPYSFLSLTSYEFSLRFYL